MTIEIHQPEVEALMARFMETGHFYSVEDALLHALRSAMLPTAAPDQSIAETKGTAPPQRRLKLDPPLVPPAGRRIRIANEEIYDLTETP